MLAVALVTAWTLLALAFGASFPEWLLLTHVVALAALIVREGALPTLNRRPLAYEVIACRGTLWLLLGGTILYLPWALFHDRLLSWFVLAVGAALLYLVDLQVHDRVERPGPNVRIELARLRLRGTRSRRVLRTTCRLLTGVVVLGLPLWALAPPAPAFLAMAALGVGLLGGIPWRRHPAPRTTAEALFVMTLPGETACAMMLNGHLDELSVTRFRVR